MKFFDWMYRKFDHNIIKPGEGFGINVKKTESIAIDRNTKALVEQVALVDVLDGWKNGLLTIGTFGFDPIAHFEYSVNQDHDDDDDDDDEQYYSGKLDADDDDDQDHDQVVLDDDHELNPLINGDDVDMSMKDNQKKEEDGRRHETTTSVDGVSRSEIVIRRRKTLRDLFSEESEGVLEINNKIMMISNTTTTSDHPRKDSGRKAAHPAALPNKSGLQFAKKLIPDHESRPIKKLNQMMRRMLKRKIHPELHGKPRKLEKESKIGSAHKLGSAPESVSLL